MKGEGSGISLEYERAFGEGTVVMGIDEAGRGPLAGPVFAAAVSVPLDCASELLAGDWSAVNDSKKLSPARRDALAAAIKSTPGCTFAITSASALEIDQSNILRATHLAMRRAALSLAEKLSIRLPATAAAPSTKHQAPSTKEKVAYHASCHLCRELGVKEAPRALIRQVAEYVPSAEEESCCGFGGTFSAKFPEISAELMRKKLAHVTESGAKRLVLDCPGCAMQLKGGADKLGLDLKVTHISELLAENLR